MRALPALLLAVAFVALAAPPATAQTLANPLCAPPPGAASEEYCTYDRAYMVMGRVLDSRGEPAKGAQVEVALAQEGVRDAQGNPPTERGSANCKGDFEFAFFGLRAPEASGRARATILPPEGQEPLTVELPLDSFYRRNDFTIRLPYEWPYACTQKPDPAWNTQISTKGRIVNRTDPYEVAGVTYHAKDYKGHVGLYYYDLSGRPHCPPDGQGGCTPIATDELGNFKYTWTFMTGIVPGGVVELVLPGGASFNATVDETTRLALLHVDASGRGPPPAQTPGLGLLLVVAALVAGARLSRSLLPAKPR